MKQYLIGFDIGTLSSKSVLTDLDGNIISKFQSEHAIEVKHAGWQEESMEMWWNEFKAAIQQFLSIEEVTAESITAIDRTDSCYVSGNREWISCQKCNAAYRCKSGRRVTGN